MRETRTIEFKEAITNTFLKTVSAFSNYDGGIILFGIDDNGNVKGRGTKYIINSNFAHKF